MAKIYKFEGYIVSPNDDEIDVEHLVERYTDGISFMYENHCSCEEFEWDDDVIPNHTDDYWEIDKFYCQLAYDRTIKELREYKSQSYKCKDCSNYMHENGWCPIDQDYKLDTDWCPALTITIGG